MPISRKKSCSACRDAKARCNKALPSCFRCSSRGLRCEYDKHGVRPFPETDYHSGASPAITLDAVTPGAMWGDSKQDWAQSSFDPSWSLFTNDPHTATHLTCDQASVMNSTIDGNYVSKEASSLLPFYEPLSPVADQYSAMVHTETRLMEVSDAATALTSPNQVLRKRYGARASLLANVVIGQLSSYPRMMIRGHSLPPFIYPPCRLDDELAAECIENRKHHCLPKALAICAGLVHMYYHGTAGNSDFVWQTIYAEQARMACEYEHYDVKDLLEGLQAVTIYMILQARDTDTIIRNNAAVMAATAMKMIGKLILSCEWTAGVPRTRTNRRNWALIESVRRTIVVLYVFSLLVEGLTGPPDQNACSGLTTVPLPCPRGLWEMQSITDWREKYDVHFRACDSGSLLTVDDLIVSQTSSECNMHDSSGRLGVLDGIKSWCENFDELGMLLWTAIPFEVNKHKLARGI